VQIKLRKVYINILTKYGEMVNEKYPSKITRIMNVLQYLQHKSCMVVVNPQNGDMLWDANHRQEDLRRCKGRWSKTPGGKRGISHAC
jgi:hypothetical protein